jgi:hypothetical protein
VTAAIFSQGDRRHIQLGFGVRGLGHALELGDTSPSTQPVPKRIPIRPAFQLGFSPTQIRVHPCSSVVNPFFILHLTFCAPRRKTYGKFFPATPSPTKQSNPKNPKNRPKIKKFRRWGERPREPLTDSSTPKFLNSQLTNCSKSSITTGIFFNSALRTPDSALKKRNRFAFQIPHPAKF